MPLPDFSNSTVFPSFEQCPEIGVDTEGLEEWCLIAQIKDDMTITKPTLVLEDLIGAPFALVFDGFGRDDFDLKKRGLKKGATAVLPRARRTPPKEEGKRGFVSVDKGSAEDVRAIRGSLDEVRRVVETMKTRKERRDAGHGEACSCCGKAGDAASLKKCTRCAEVRYCSKVSSLGIRYLGPATEFATGLSGQRLERRAPQR
jgi:hypothetical protein